MSVTSAPAGPLCSTNRESARRMTSSCGQPLDAADVPLKRSVAPAAHHARQATSLDCRHDLAEPLIGRARSFRLCDVD